MKIINLIALDGNVFSVCANPAYFLQLTMGKGLDSNGAQTQYIERKGKNAGHCAEDTFNLFRIKMLLLPRPTTHTLICSLFITSANRFGEIPPLLQNFKTLRQFFEGLVSVWQNFEPTLAKRL